jgi:hypothetical protein
MPMVAAALDQFRPRREPGRGNTAATPGRIFEVLREADLLHPIVFGDHAGKRRRKVAEEIAKCSAKDHIGICRHLGRVFKDEEPAIALLPGFSRPADAGIAAMEVHLKRARRGPRLAAKRRSS